MNFKETVEMIKGKIPENINGVEKQAIISEEIKILSSKEIMVLKEQFENLLKTMIEKNASDMDIGGLGCKEYIWYRVNGVKKPDMALSTNSIDETDILLQSILVERQRELLLEQRNLDFSYQFNSNGYDTRFRGDIYFDLNHLCLNMRLIPQEIRQYKNLGFHPNVSKAMNLTNEKVGLILITGITGSGKSSTLDSIIDANNKTADAHIVIIASPVETVHKPIRSIIRHREVGKDVLSFKEGTIQALRQDPDIIVVGEMRDPDTIMTALEVTDSGHKVFSTLHTASAVESIDRIIAECPSEEQERVRVRLADTLRCVVSQKLVQGLNGKLVLAKEIMLMIPSIAAAIKNNSIGEIYQMINESGALGMVTMEKDLLRLHKEKIISYESAVNFANNKKRMSELLSM